MSTSEHNKETLKNLFEARLKLAFTGMNKRGFFEGRKCSKCEIPLQGEGSGRPAESYAGTYTGLCYGCQNAGVFKVTTYETGASLWSHPPYCPSWRRDREEFLAYDNCKECNRGRIIVSKSFAEGGPYPKYCRSCMERHNKALQSLKE